MTASRIAKFLPALLALGFLATASAFAQTAPTPSPTPSVAAPPAPTMTLKPAPPASPTPAPSSTATPSAAPTPSPQPPPDHSSAAPASNAVDLVARPAAYTEGKTSHEEVFAAIQNSLAAIRAEMDKANLKPAGRPLAVFLEADDENFRYRAEIPLDAAPAGQTQLSPNVKIGQTPVAKAMRFEHRGAYDDIDATYEALTAYLDEKGIDAQDVFVEEYLNDVKTSDDPNLQVDIYVLLK